MDLTIKQLANRLKISRPTVEVRMNHIPDFRDKYTQKKGNKIMINDVGCKLISKTKTTPHHHKNTRQVSNQRDRSIILKVLHNQDIEQSDMIKSQGQTIKKLTKLLDQQQQLQLATQSENKHLKNRVKKLTHVSTKDNVLAFNHKNLSSIGKITKPKQSKADQDKEAKVETARKKAKAKRQKKARHRSFWQRFFGK